MTLTPYIDDGDQVIHHGDCIEVMRELPAESVSVIITDPPYGLEFMGKEWDRFRVDDPGTRRWRDGRQGGGGGATIHGPDDTDRPSRVAYGGKRPTTHRCTTCGKRDAFRNPHQPCGDGTWQVEPVDPNSAPPSLLAFQEWTRTWAIEALRVLKPGAHLLAFGGTRTYHRLAAGLEDAGFEIRDCLTWLYGQGYPKSLDVSKAIDKAAGAEREVVGIKPSDRPNSHGHQSGSLGGAYTPAVASAPATPEAAAWEGWGTALKPAWEPIILARKPLTSSVAANVLTHGTGALNIDAARIPFADQADETEAKDKNQHGDYGTPQGGNTVYGDYSMLPPRENYDAPGRWPANLVLDQDAADQLDATTDGQGDGGHWPRARGAGGLSTSGHTGQDGLDVSRFFYTAKASTSERNHGLDSSARAANHHPTVKPLALMRWLVRLATPPGGTILDPFVGSGTTLLAARAEGVRGIGIELDPDYLPIAAGRLAQLSLFALEADA